MKVVGAVAVAKASAAIPSAALQLRYGRALARFARAAADCEAGISAHPYGDEAIETHQNQHVLHRAMSEFATGAKELFRATARLRELILSHRR